MVKFSVPEPISEFCPAVPPTTSAPGVSGAESFLATARSFTRAGRHGEALEELRRAVQQDPLTPRVHLDIAFASARVGDLTSARASWEHVLRLAPEDDAGVKARAALDALNELQRLTDAHADE